MVYKIQQQEKLGEKYSKKEIEHDMSKFSQQLTLWGSNKVIQKFIKFRSSGQCIFGFPFLWNPSVRGGKHSS